MRTTSGFWRLEIYCCPTYFSQLQTCPNLHPPPRVGPPLGCLPQGDANLGKFFSCSEPTEDSLGVRVCACLFWSFGAPCASRWGKNRRAVPAESETSFFSAINFCMISALFPDAIFFFANLLRIHKLICFKPEVCICNAKQLGFNGESVSAM